MIAMENNRQALTEYLQDYLLLPEPNSNGLPSATISALDSKNLLLKKSDGTMQLDTSCEEIQNALLLFSLQFAKKDMPATVKEAMALFSKTEKLLLTSGKSYILPLHTQKAFDTLRVAMISKLDISFQAYEVLMSEDMLLKKRPKGLKNYEKYYFEYLAVNQYSAEHTFRSYARLYDFQDHHQPHFYFKSLNSMPIERLEEIYHFSTGAGKSECDGLIAAILTALMQQDALLSLTYAKQLLGSNPREALQAIAQFNATGLSELEDIFSHVLACSPDNEKAAHFYAVVIAKTATHKEATEQLKRKALSVAAKLVSHQDHSIADACMLAFSHGIEGYENERYSLLHIYLGNTKKIAVLKYFFNTFSDPKYLFDLMLRMYEVAKFRINIDHFGQALSYFWGRHRDATEQEILKLFEYPSAYAVLGVKVMLSGHSRPYRIDLLKLNEAGQLNAIVAICGYPHSIEELLPPLLSLRHSAYPEVVETLQEGLSMLILEAYHTILYERTASIVDKDGGDDAFLQPLKEALEQYQEVCRQKESCKELDPLLNEKKHIDLYYGLEHETNAKAMKEMDKREDSWLSSIKNTVIIRGKAWKTDGDDRITPLTYIQTSMLIDSRAYKNPPAYERMLDELQWK